MPQQIVFYSWQSWTDGAANRSFIQDCLERAIKAIRKDESLKLEPVIDRDTLGVAGSADIAKTIFEKIAEADVFVADVSFVGALQSGKLTPNPNVLVELGYAIAKLGESRIICVHNLATGRVEDLPFDLRGRRVAPYELATRPAADDSAWVELRAKQRERFVALLKEALIAILSATDPATAQFISQIADKLAYAIIYGNEAGERIINPGADKLRTVFETVANQLQAIACESIAVRLNLANRLVVVADALELIVRFTRGVTQVNRESYVDLVGSAIDKAKALRADLLVGTTIRKEFREEILDRLHAIRRHLDSLVARLTQMLGRPGGLKEIYADADSLGMQVIRFGMLGTDAIQPGLSQWLTEVGTRLHLIGVTQDYAGGAERAILKTEETLRIAAKEFGNLVDSLPRPI